MTLHIRNLTPRPTTADLDARTVEAIVSTGSDAPRAGYIERLDLDGADLSGLMGAPLLDGHQSRTTRDQLGVIEAAERRPEGLWARLKFRSNPAAQAVLTDIAEGTLRGLSIGYSVSEWQDARAGNQRIRTAKKWRPVEISIVPMPADPGAHFRAGTLHMHELEIETTTPPAEEIQTRAAQNAEIRTIAATAGLTRAWADEQIDAAAHPDEARRAAFDAMQRRSSETTTRTARATITTDHTAPEAFVTRAGEALSARINPAHELSAPARQYAGMTLPDLARECLRRSGTNTSGMAADTLITRAAFGTSDFPEVLGYSLNRELRRIYEAAPSGAIGVARQSTARDFREQHKISFAASSPLKKVLENGEFENGRMKDSAESYRLHTAGLIQALTRQALVNDDMGAFRQVTRFLGISARNYEIEQIVSEITRNPEMSDGQPVFHTTRGNTVAAAAISVASLGAARTALRQRKGLLGEPINATPRFVLVPAELETQAEQALATIAATKTEDSNPFDNLSLLVDPRLPAATWYVVADPGLIDGLEYAYLEGAPGPQIETRMGFETDNMQIKVRLDIGTGWTDWRGWQRVGTGGQ